MFAGFFKTDLRAEELRTTMVAVENVPDALSQNGPHENIRVEDEVLIFPHGGGAEIIPATDEAQDRARFRDLELLRFKDPNGVVVELRGRLA